LRWVARRQGEEGVLALIEKYQIVGLVLDRRENSGRQLLPVLEPRYGCEATVADRCILRIPR
jgi:hypothetical protein